MEVSHELEWAVLGLLAAVVALLVLAPAWQALPDAPDARSEVVAAAVDGRVAVLGGFTPSGEASARADIFDPDGGWSRLPDLPLALHHAMAASDGHRLYVAGGYANPSGLSAPSNRAFVLDVAGGAERPLGLA